jgi:enamine deaminase RidA (YjgF/YER057c/UK114 family)
VIDHVVDPMRLRSRHPPRATPRSRVWPRATKERLLDAQGRRHRAAIAGSGRGARRPEVSAMGHQFLQPDGLAKPRGYSHVVRARGNSVHIAGQVAFDAEGRIVGPGDLRMQTEQVFKNLGRALQAAGARTQDLVKTTIFVVNFKPSDREVIAEVRSRFYGDHSPPASTLVGVQALVLPELLIEVEAVAVIDDA